MEDVCKQLKSINCTKPSGYDCIPPKTVQMCHKELAQTIAMLIDTSFEQGQYPSPRVPDWLSASGRPSPYEGCFSLLSYSKILVVLLKIRSSFSNSGRLGQRDDQESGTLS